MVLNTDRFGEIVVDAEKIITFPSGILGCGSINVIFYYMRK